MMHSRRPVLAALAVTLSVCVGCETREPDETTVSNGNDALPPTHPVHLDATLASGRADFPAFRDPDEEPAPAAAPEGTAPQGTAAGGNADTAPLNDLVIEYNGFAKESSAANTDELLEYFVEDQADAIRNWIQASYAAVDAHKKLADALKGAFPGDAERIDTTMNAATAATYPTVNVTAITVEGEKPVGALADGTIDTNVEFTLDGEAWYIGFADTQALDARTAALTQLADQTTQQVATVTAGNASLDAALSTVAIAADDDGGAGGG